MSISFQKLVDRLSLPMMQHRDEIIPFCEWMCERGRPRVVVEIGAGHGGTTELLGHLACDWIISVDLPDGASTGMSMVQAVQRNRVLSDIHPHFRGILGNSRDVSTYEEVLRMTGGEIDLLFIDGDHSLEGVLGDYELYKPLLTPKAVVAFHDINAWTFIPERVEVPLFWEQLQDPTKREFSAGGNWGGIGVVEA